LEIKTEVQKYYGQTLASSSDLKTNACTTDSAYPPHIKAIMKDVHPEVLAKYYGCGLAIPSALTDCRVLDLGSGSGRDCYILAKLVGPHGSVVGVEMTDEQLEVARSHQAYHADRWQHDKSNVDFLKGDIEDLAALGLPDESFDLITSNCVINLASDKAAVLQEAYRTLKCGGELYFSDVYADRRIPEHLQQDPVLYGECLSGALYWNDFLRLAHQAGFKDPRVMSASAITIGEAELAAKVGGIKFYSVTYRLFKLPELESDCEDYGQAVAYRGNLSDHPYEFALDQHHVFPTGKLVPVCGNSYDMLHDTRFREHFEFFGERKQHYGIFTGCGVNAPFKDLVAANPATASQSCC
jgi:arsenite methyltransferase